MWSSYECNLLDYDIRDNVIFFENSFASQLMILNLSLTPIFSLILFRIQTNTEMSTKKNSTQLKMSNRKTVLIYLE
jgi:hypothetical protein